MMRLTFLSEIFLGVGCKGRGQIQSHREIKGIKMRGVNERYKVLKEQI